MSHPLVSLHDISQRFDGAAPVLSGVSLSVEAGRCVALVGPSGCGKSTLLRLIAGLLQPTTGQITRAGSPETAFVFQDPTLLPWLSVEANVAVPLALRGVNQADRLTRAREALARVGLSDRATFFPRQLSGGQRMRVSLARALAVKPQLLLLDEPFGALDELTRDRLNEDLLRLRAQENWSVVLVTHSVSEAVFVSDRVVLLEPNPGRVRHVFDVPLVYPRNHDTRCSAAYHATVDRLSGALRELTPALA
ncbi:ABC transporter ATP-binding protein [Nibricoccus sp. IMCC34717]|uniref:ABC transporter ATP-binding protein n=1 Tax=Nibricoccus sp. IMCC34717 TaxID=3034021 RepID=UPI00384A557D